MSCCCCSGVLIAGAVLVAILAKFYFGKKQNEKPKLKKEDYKKDIVYLFQFKRSEGLPNISPYCMKIETFLRAHKIQYEVIENNFQRSQKGLLPFIELNGEQIADSEFIIEHLSKHFNIKENAPKEVSAAGRAVSRMFDTEVFRIHLAFKRKEDEFAKLLLADVPGLLVPLVIPVAKWFMNRRLGPYGDFSDAELKQLYRRNLQATSDLLGDKKFFGGNEPISADFSVSGHLIGLYYLRCPNELKCIIEEFPNLKKLMNTVIREYYPDFDVAKRLKESSLEASESRLIDRMTDTRVFACANIDRICFHPFEMAEIMMDGKFPNMLKYIFGPILKRKVMERLIYDGIGRLSKNEIFEIYEKDLAAIETYLQSRKPSGGLNRTEACIFGHLAVVLCCPYEIKGKELIETRFPTIKDFVTSNLKRYYD